VLICFKKFIESSYTGILNDFPIILSLVGGDPSSGGHRPDNTRNGALLWMFLAIAQTELETSPSVDTRTIDQVPERSVRSPERTRADETMTKESDPRLRPMQPIQVEQIERAAPPAFQVMMVVAALGVFTWYFVALALPMAAGSVVAFLAASSLAPLNAIYLGILTACAMWFIYAFAFHRFTATASRRLLVAVYGLMVSIWCYMLMYALEPSITLHPALHHWGAMFCSVALGVVSIARLTTERVDSPPVE